MLQNPFLNDRLNKLSAEINKLSIKEGEEGFSNTSEIVDLRNRLSSLNECGTASILVGGNTSVGRMNLMTLIEDTVYATRSALLYGRLRGSYLDSLLVCNNISDLFPGHEDTDEYVSDCFYNAYLKYVQDLLKISIEDIIFLNKENCGYDLIYSTIVKNDECTVMNPLETETSTLQAIAEVVGILISTNAVSLLNDMHTKEELL